MIDISTTETLKMKKKFPGSRHKFTEKREIALPKFLENFSAPISREETPVFLIPLSKVNFILAACFLLKLVRSFKDYAPQLKLFFIMKVLLTNSLY